MKIKLHPLETEILLTRVSIARSTGLFNIDKLAQEWVVSRATILRYESPYYRDLNRKAARKVTELQRKRDKHVCQLCPLFLAGHPRCPHCTMLLHGDPECSCIDTVSIRIM